VECAVFYDEENIIFWFISNRTQGNFSLKSEFLLPIIHVLNDLKIEVTLGKRKDLWLPGECKISGITSHMEAISRKNKDYKTQKNAVDLYFLNVNFIATFALNEYVNKAFTK